MFAGRQSLLPWNCLASNSKQTTCLRLRNNVLRVIPSNHRGKLIPSAYFVRHDNTNPLPPAIKKENLAFTSIKITEKLVTPSIMFIFVRRVSRHMVINPRDKLGDADIHSILIS